MVEVFHMVNFEAVPGVYCFCLDSSCRSDIAYMI